MSFSNLKLSARLSIAFGFMLALLVLTAGLAMMKLRDLNQHVHYLNDNTVPSLTTIGEMRRHLQDVRRLESQHVMLDTDAEMGEFEKRIDKSRSELTATLKRYEAHVSDDDDRKLWQEASAASDAYLRLWDGVRVISRKSVTDTNAGAAARKLLFGESRVAFGKANDSFNKLAQYNEQLARVKADESQAMYNQSLVFISFLAAIAAILGAVAAWLVTRSVTRPLMKAVEVAQRVAAGDLTSRIEVKTQEETGMLLAALRDMNASLANIVSNVRIGAETVGSASGQIAAGNSDLSQRTEEQASSLEETASSMEELTSTVKQNAENARQANQLATGASTMAVKGGEVVGQVVSSMASINESSKKIADIISVIDGIAFQTNILALNAAVEAARAGEQGRGFAVVASEVRTLAQRSAAAAKEIKTLITDSVGKVEDGSKLVNQAGKTMEEIVTSVKRVTDIMAEIAAASQEQTSGIEQINQAVTQMDQVTQQNAALVEEAAAAAESMQQQAQSLTSAVAIFKLSAAEDASVLRDTGVSQHEREDASRHASSVRPEGGTATHSKGNGFVERRGPNRARNVTRLSRPIPQLKASKAANGDDNWQEF